MIELCIANTDIFDHVLILSNEIEIVIPAKTKCVHVIPNGVKAFTDAANRLIVTSVCY